MDTEQVQRNQREDGPGEEGLFDVEEFVAPGAPIVRSSTPRLHALGLYTSSEDRPQAEAAQPLEHEALSAFPMEAPSAPPLPEEIGEPESDVLHTVVEVTPLPLAGGSEPSEEESSEFFWLFEYALEMDVSVLNSPQRLDGQALLYGPAVLKGFELTFDVVSSRNGPVTATILPSRSRGAEVWGVLYRIPRRLVEQLDSEPGLLDKIHAAVPPDGLFERTRIIVHEAYRARDVRCITYIASALARNQFHLLPRDRQVVDASYMQHLLESARKVKMPEAYLSELTARSASHEDEDVDIQREVPGSKVEQNTEPLPALKDEKLVSPSASTVQLIRPTSHLNVGMFCFALYLVLTLLAVFSLAVVQGSGVGSGLFTVNFTPLGIPWFVLVYGLIGGCLSCIVALGRQYATRLPNFVLMTWYTRPYFGVVLAGLVYLLLNSGLFTLSGSVEQHAMLFSLLAVLAGACEGWLFFRRM
ncbi:MAG: hypothetical protein NVSMB33_17010 [Ktedonobacteraceae bacterium]